MQVDLKMDPCGLTLVGRFPEALEFHELGSANSSLQVRVLRFGLLQEGDVRVGVFPEREEVFIGGERLGGIACHGVGTTDLKADGATRGVGRRRAVRPGWTCGTSAAKIKWPK